jgi:ATP-dependent DNA ligase
MRIENFTYFFPEKPRLMSINSPLFEIMSKSNDWVAEKKWNGNRLQLHVLPGREFQFWNRHGEKLNYTPSEEVEDVLNCFPWPKGYCLLDGELRHNKVVGVKHLIVLYDVFIWDRKLLTGLTFRERRREYLENIIGYGYSSISVPEWYYHGFGYAFNEVIDDPEIEGLVIKNLNGKLSLGRASASSSLWMWKVRKESGRYRF